MLFYFCIAYLSFFFCVWLFFYLRWRFYPPVKTESPIFNFLKIHFEIVKIKNDLYYYRGLYLTDKHLIHKGFKVEHFQNKNFLFRYLKTIRI